MQRLMRDFKRLQQDPPQGVNGSPNADNIMLWNAVIFGPEETPWDGGESLLQHQNFFLTSVHPYDRGHAVVSPFLRDVVHCVFTICLLLVSFIKMC